MRGGREGKEKWVRASGRTDKIRKRHVTNGFWQSHQLFTPPTHHTTAHQNAAPNRDGHTNRTEQTEVENDLLMEYAAISALF
jgi:hypothetical protein